MTYHHNTKTLCSSCNASESHTTQSAALAAIDWHILITGHTVNYYLAPAGWLLFGGF